MDQLDDDETDAVVMAAVWQYVSVYWDQLHRMCLKAARGDENLAEELMSDEVYRMLPRLVERWDRSRSFPSYVNAYFYQHLRKITARKFHKRLTSLSVLENVDKQVTTITASEDVENKLECEELLAKLEPLERSILVMCKMYGYTYREVAERLGVSYGYIAKVIKAAIVKLKQ